MCILVAGLFYNSHLNVDQFGVEHRRHLVGLKQRVDKDHVRHLIEVEERRLQDAAARVSGGEPAER